MLLELLLQTESQGQPFVTNTSHRDKRLALRIHYPKSTQTVKGVDPLGIVATWSSGNESDNCGKYRRSNNRPDNGEGLASDVDHEQFG